MSKKSSTFVPKNDVMMEEGHVFEDMYRAIDTTEMAVLRNVNRFPVYGKDIIQIDNL